MLFLCIRNSLLDQQLEDSEQLDLTTGFTPNNAQASPPTGHGVSFMIQISFHNDSYYNYVLMGDDGVI